MADQDKRTQEGQKRRKEGKKWLSRIKDAEKLEDTFLKDAGIAEGVFTGEGANQADYAAETYDFNILFSNVETIVPAIINSPPLPDIRRRFGDADPVARDFAELIERAIKVQVDDGKLQVELEGVAQSAFLAGRGIPRLRFRADFVGEPERDEIAEEAKEEAGVRREDDEHGEYSDAQGDAGPSERAENERITFEAVSWRDYRHGPAKRWEDRKWDAFRHSMAVEDVEAFQDAAMVSGQRDAEDRIAQGESDDDLVVWEIWCRKTRKVKFVLEPTGMIIKEIEDPLGLSGFFPIPAPVQPVEVVGRLKPVNPFRIYRKLADELDVVTKRINVLLKALKLRGWYAGDAKELENVMSLEDNEFTPIENAEQWASHGGLEGAIAFWPIDKIVQVLRELYASREEIKQAIYEITGISDIVRGATKASETLGAQQIKTQWGSLRIQKAQRAMERCARDLFVMMSEIIPAKFSVETLQKMTGVQLIPTEQDLQEVRPQLQEGMTEEQAQQATQEAQKAERKRLEKLAKLEGLNRMLGERVTAYYRVDVETDSTVRADLTRQKQEISEFLNGSAAYFQAVGPLVKDGSLPREIAIEIYASSARLFNLGKSAEDAIEQMIQQAKDAAKQPQPPDPETIKAQAEMEAKQQDMKLKTMQAQMDQQKAETDFAAKSKELEMKLAEKMAGMQETQQKAQAEAAIALMDQQLKEIELDIRRTDLEIKQEDLRIRRETKPKEPA